MKARNTVTSLKWKFNYDQLRNRKVLVLWKSDNNKNNNNNVCSRWGPVPGFKNCICKARALCVRVWKLCKCGIRVDGVSWRQSTVDCRRLPSLAPRRTLTPGSTLRVLEWAGSQPAPGLPWSLWSNQSSRRCWTCHPPAHIMSTSISVSIFV